MAQYVIFYFYLSLRNAPHLDASGYPNKRKNIRRYFLLKNLFHQAKSIYALILTKTFQNADSIVRLKN